MKRFFLILSFLFAAAGCSKIPGSIEQAQPPVFSRAAGIYGLLTDPVAVELSTPTAGAEIRYTLDGTAPSASSLLYSAPISMFGVGKTFRIRAISICSGMATSDVAGADYVLVSAGTEDTVWEADKIYNDSVGIGIVVPSSGLVCVVGYKTNISGSSSEEDAVIKMFNKNGDSLWESVYATPEANDRFIAVDADSDGNLYAAGTRKDNSSDVIDVDWTLRKIDSTGASKWDTVFVRDSGNDYMNAVRVDSKNNVYIAGSGYNRLGPDSRDDWWVKKLDSEGREIVGWDMSFDGHSDEDYINEIAIDSQDNVYLVGCGKNLVGADSGFDWRVIKLNESGVKLFDQVYDGNKGDDYINSIAIDKTDDSIYLVGNGENIVGSATLADRWIKKLKPDGTQIWDQKYDGNGGNDYLNSAAVDSDGYLHVVGAGYVVINGSSNYDWWLERLDKNGAINTIYPQTLDVGNNAYYANTIVVDLDNTYVTGYIEYQQGLETREKWWVKKFYR